MRLPTAVVAVVVLGSLCQGPAEAGCVSSDTVLCLLDDRFQLELTWEEFAGNPFTLPGAATSGVAHGVELTDDGGSVEQGYFWLRDDQDVDLLVSLLDGRPINEHFWVFFGSVSNVDYDLRITDTVTDEVKTYSNEPGEFLVTTDVKAFPLTEESSTAGGRRGVGASVLHRAAQIPDCASSTVLCVQGDRVAVEVGYNTFQEGSEVPPHPATVGLRKEASGTFWLFDPDNQEIVAQVVDGRSVNGSFWAFFAGITNVKYTVTFTDRNTGQSRSYLNPLGEFTAFGDRNPFTVEPPPGDWMETAALPGFRFKVRISFGGEELPSQQETECISETLCVSGSLPGRSELFVRIVGPKPNGYLWPTIVKFSTSTIELWVEQTSTQQVNYYRLEGATPGSSDLTGFFDRYGFLP